VPEMMMDAPPMSPPGAAGPMPPQPSGPTGPATTPPQNAGMRQRGFVLVGGIVVKLLEESIKLLGSTTPEGRAALKALATLAPVFGAASGDLGMAQMKLLTERAAPVSTPSPGTQDAIRQRLGGMGLGGGGAAAVTSPAPPMAGAA